MKTTVNPDGIILYILSIYKIYNIMIYISHSRNQREAVEEDVREEKYVMKYTTVSSVLITPSRKHIQKQHNHRQERYTFTQQGIYLRCLTASSRLMLWKTKYGSLKSEYFASVLLATKTSCISSFLHKGRLAIKAAATTL